MAIDVQNPKVTWAALWVMAGLVFSTGAAWNTLLNNGKTDASQWRIINKNTRKTNIADKEILKINIATKDFEAGQKSNEVLSKAIIKLTAAVDNWESRATRDEREKEKSEAFMLNMSKQISSIQTDIAVIKEQYKDNK